MKSLDSFSTSLPLLRAKKAEFQVDIGKLKAECAVIRERIQRCAIDPGNDHSNRVNKLLGRPTMPVVDSDEVRLRALLVELTDFQNAAHAVDAAILTETRLASNKMLDAVKPEASRLGSDFAKAFLALREAHLKYVKFVDDVDSTCTNVESLRVYPPGLSDPSDRSGNYAYGLREFVNAGLISKSMAPEYI
jgi:hypothetical protein